MKVSTNKTCVFCGQRLEEDGKELTIHLWYINCSNEGDWGLDIAHKECVEKTIVLPMIDDGDGVLAPLSESDDDSEEQDGTT
jgi:hypothetical protein